MANGCLSPKWLAIGYATHGQLVEAPDLARGNFPLVAPACRSDSHLLQKPRRCPAVLHAKAWNPKALLVSFLRMGLRPLGDDQNQSKQNICHPEKARQSSKLTGRVLETTFLLRLPLSTYMVVGKAHFGKSKTCVLHPEIAPTGIYDFAFLGGFKYYHSALPSKHILPQPCPFSRPIWSYGSYCGFVWFYSKVDHASP